MRWFFPKSSLQKSNLKRFLSYMEREKNEELLTCFAHVGEIVDVLSSLGVHMPVEDAIPKIIEVLTTTDENEQ